MTTDYAAIKEQVSEIIQQSAVSFSVTYAGEREKTEHREKPGQCDAWRFTFKAGKQTYSGEYFTGLGLRKARPGAPADKGNANTLYREEWENRWMKPEAPHVADVLHSLVMDAEADGMSFRDWCDNYGYSEDSISAFESYRECCAIAVSLRTIFKRETLTAIREAVQEL